jgi:4-oxalocrotonate tautomerase family enzyme
MPFVSVKMWAGRSVEQKRRLAKAITDAMVEHAAANPEHLHVAMEDVPLDSWSRAGVLAIDATAHSTGNAGKPPHVFGLGHLLLQVADLPAAEAFYLDFLGLTVRKREDFRDGRQLIVTDQGLGLTSGRPDVSASIVEHIAFRARGIEQFAQRARLAEIPIVDGPSPSGYGVSLYLLDPDGNKIEVFGDAAGT